MVFRVIEDVLLAGLLLAAAIATGGWTCFMIWWLAKQLIERGKR